MLRTPSGQSHSTCKAMVGQTPVSRCTCPASLNFSSVVVAAAGCVNLPNRVPVFANPQDGSSIRNVSSALQIFSLLRASIGDLSYGVEVTILNIQGHEFLGGNRSFRIAERPLSHFARASGPKSKRCFVFTISFVTAG